MELSQSHPRIDEDKGTKKQRPRRIVLVKNSDTHFDKPSKGRNDKRRLASRSSYASSDEYRHENDHYGDDRFASSTVSTQKRDEPIDHATKWNLDLCCSRKGGYVARVDTDSSTETHPIVLDEQGLHLAMNASQEQGLEVWYGDWESVRRDAETGTSECSGEARYASPLPTEPRSRQNQQEIQGLNGSLSIERVEIQPSTTQDQPRDQSHTKKNRDEKDILLQKYRERIHILECDLNQLNRTESPNLLHHQVMESMAREEGLLRELADATEAAKKAESWWKLLDSENEDLQKTLFQCHERVKSLESETTELKKTNEDLAEKERKLRQERKVFHSRGIQQKMRIAELERQVEEHGDPRCEAAIEYKEPMQSRNETEDVDTISKEREGLLVTIKEKEDLLLTLLKDLERTKASAENLERDNKITKDKNRELQDEVAALQEKIRGEEAIELEQANRQEMMTKEIERQGERLVVLSNHLQDFTEREAVLRQELEVAKAEATVPPPKENQQEGTTETMFGSLGHVFGIGNKTKNGLAEEGEDFMVEEPSMKILFEPTNEEKMFCFMVIFFLLLQLKEALAKVKEYETRLEVYDHQLEKDCSEIWTLQVQNKELQEIVGNIEEVRELLNGQKEILQWRVDQQDASINNLESRLLQAGAREEMLKNDCIRAKVEANTTKHLLLSLQNEIRGLEAIHQNDLNTAQDRIEMLQDELRDQLVTTENYKEEMREEGENFASRTKHQQQSLATLETQLDDSTSKNHLLAAEVEDAKDETAAANCQLHETEERLRQLQQLLSSKESECERIGSLEVSMDELQVVIKNLVEERDLLVNERKITEAQVKQKEKTISELKTQQEDHGTKIKSLQTELVCAAQKSSESILAQSRDLNDAQNQIATLVEENKRLKKQLEREHTEIKTREEQQKAETAAQRKGAEERVRNMEESLKKHRNELEIARQRIRKVLEK